MSKRESLAQRAAKAAGNANNGIVGDTWVAGERERAYRKGYLAGWRAAKRVQKGAR